MATMAGILRRPLIDEQAGDNVYHRVYYVRYADDYLIAVKGPKWLAKEIMKKSQDFLKSSLHFSLKGAISFTVLTMRYASWDLILKSRDVMREPSLKHGKY